MSGPADRLPRCPACGAVQVIYNIGIDPSVPKLCPDCGGPPPRLLDVWRRL